jgi:antitoxin MazE
MMKWMRTRLSRWGNSLAIRIPATIASEASLHEGVTLSIEYSDGVLHLRPESKRLELDDLLKGISEENVHDEVDFGGPVGREVW